MPIAPLSDRTTVTSSSGKSWALLAALPASAFANTPDHLPENIAVELAQAGFPKSEVGVYVHDLTGDRKVLSFGADWPLNPPSVRGLVR